MTVAFKKATVTFSFFVLSYSELLEFLGSLKLHQPIGVRGMGENRFKGKLSEEYRLVALAYPEIETFQGLIGSQIAALPAKDSEKLKVIEIGTGDGITTDVLLRSRSDLFVISIDNEAKMIELASENLRSWKEEQEFELICSDAISYMESLDEDSIDAIASAWTLHNLLSQDREQVLRASFRALAPDGLFVNGDKYAQNHEAQNDALRLQIERFFDAYQPLGKHEFLRDFVLHNIADESPRRIMRESEAIELMQAIGFVGIEIIYRENMEAILVARKPGC